MKTNAHRWAPALALAVTLGAAGCAARAPAPIEERDIVGEIRQQAAQSDATVEVYALSDPGSEPLLERARVAEEAGDIDQATRLVREALTLRPDDPAHLQYLAELELQRRDFRAAIEYAGQSHQFGPRIGPLCYRSWLTRQHAQQALGQSEQALTAAREAEQCLRPGEVGR